MALKRLDNVGIVVEDLEATIELFRELGLGLERRATVEGEWAGRVTGLADGTHDGDHTRRKKARELEPAISSIARFPAARATVTVLPVQALVRVSTATGETVDRCAPGSPAQSARLSVFPRLRPARRQYRRLPLPGLPSALYVMGRSESQDRAMRADSSLTTLAVPQLTEGSGEA
jgi:catechol 2,3-dioxygenase-like lactoylglutathione lyase family enzyme